MLSELLAAPEPSFTSVLQHLETESGHPDIDVRLSADITKNAHLKIKELGLDPNDTNGRELYHALQSLVQKHNDFLTKAVGGDDPTDVADLIPRLIAAVKNLPIIKSSWALKHSSAKRLLKTTPPKKVMKHLGYRSIDSMLKREDIDELYASLRFAESASWLNRFITSYKKLQPNDFETRDISIIAMTSDKWGDLSQDFVYSHHHNIASLKEMGVIAVLPMPVDRLQGVSITVLPLLIHYINELRLYSAFFKLQQVKPHFANIVINTIARDPKNTATVAGQPVHWRVIQQHFGKGNINHPEVFEPHVQPDDLAWKSAEDILYTLEPALKFWQDLDHVAVMHDGRPVPFGLRDNAVSFCNSLPYGQQSSQNFQDNLTSEIFVRYLGQESIEEQVVKQLDNGIADPKLMIENLRSLF